MANLDELVHIHLMNIRNVEGHVRFHARRDAFLLSDRGFKNDYRLTKEMVRQLINQLDPILRQQTRRSSLDSRTKVLVALNFLAKGSYQQNIGRNMYAAVSQPSVSRSLVEFVNALNTREIFDTHVKFPANLRELQEVQIGFYEKYRLPGIVGCIDCTHVAIKAPPFNDPMYPENIYVNRKGYHSINVQLICDVNTKILNVCAQYPGSTHDAYIWQNSEVNTLLQQLHNRGHAVHLLGDSGYPLRPWLLTPVLNAIPGSPEERYNSTHQRIRSTIERCNGILKTRFRCLLKHRVLHYHPERAAKIINACVMLHNFCIEHQLPHPELVAGDDLGLEHILLEVHEERQQNNDYLAGRRVQERLIRLFFT